MRHPWISLPLDSSIHLTLPHRVPHDARSTETATVMRELLHGSARDEIMTMTPLELLDTAIAQLQTLVTFLDDQLCWTESAASETRACAEIARSLRLLIRDHRAQYGSCVGALGGRASAASATYSDARERTAPDELLLPATRARYTRV